nr:MAG TPA: hypothetical protein [Caudoviricetes sp.]
MEYVAKVTLYHNTKGLIEEGTTVEFTKEEVAEYDKDYFKDLFETVGAEEVAEVEPTEETVETTEENVEPTEEKPKAKTKGKKAEETAE